MKTNVSLNFYGNCEEALNFYSQVFETEITAISRYKDMPAGDNYDVKVEEKDLDKVMHSSFNISDNLIVMAVDDVMGITKPGTSVGLSLNFTNEDELETSKKIYEKLSEGGKIMMPYEKTFWGAYYCQIIDKFGIKWEVNHQLQ